MNAIEQRIKESGLSLREFAKKVIVEANFKGDTVGETTVFNVIKGEHNTHKTPLYQELIKKVLNDLTESTSDEGYLTYAQGKMKARISKMEKSGRSFFELVFGDTGRGKTYLLKKLAGDKSRLYVKARQAQSASAFINMLLRTLGMPVYSNIDERLVRFCAGVKSANIKTIVIDEADLFCDDNDRTFRRKMELMREIYEYSLEYNLGISVIVVGLGNLGKRIAELGGYVQSRFTFAPEITIKEEELEHIGRLKGLGEEVIAAVKGEGNARIFEMIEKNKDTGLDEKLAFNLVYKTRGGVR